MDNTEDLTGKIKTYIALLQIMITILVCGVESITVKKPWRDKRMLAENKSLESKVGW